MSWEEKLGYYAQLAILMNTINSFLEGFMPICISALFTTAVAYNAMIFAFLAQSNNVFVSCFMMTASMVVTFIGFSIFKYAELMESLSHSLVKELQMSALLDIRRRMFLRNLAQTRKVDGSGDGITSSAIYCQGSSSGFKRNFQRMPLKLQVQPFGTIKTGHAATWIQQIIDNTVSAIFMVKVMDPRMIF